MAEKTGGLRRRTAFDGMRPRDFVVDEGPGRGSWPEGPFRDTFPAGSLERLTADELTDPELTDHEARVALEVVKALAADVESWRRWRRANDLTLAAAARRACVSPTRLGDLENGNRFPAFDLMYRLKWVMKQPGRSAR